MHEAQFNYSGGCNAVSWLMLQIRAASHMKPCIHDVCNVSPLQVYARIYATYPGIGMREPPLHDPGPLACSVEPSSHPPYGHIPQCEH
jgi:hypothetical protein